MPVTALRRYRRHRKLPQTSVARLLDVSQVSISNWERGVTRPHRRYVRDLETLFGAPIADLLKDDDGNPKAPAMTAPDSAKNTKLVSSGV